MDKKKLLTVMSLAVGLGTLTVLSDDSKINVSATGTSAVQKFGDVNNDGLVDTVDAAAVLTEYARLSALGKGNFTEIQKKVADIDKNNLVDTVDSAYILSYYAYASTGGSLDLEQWLENRNPNTTTTTTTATTTATTTSSSVQTTQTTVSTTTTTVTTTSTTVSAVSKISEIKLTKYNINIAVGENDISYVTMLPETVPNKDEIWTSSDEKIAVVDKWGNVTGVSAGTCTVTVTSVDNPEVKADIKVTVSDPNKISEIKLSKTEMNIAVGKGDISYVTMLPESVSDKREIWTSSDEKIAVVDDEGYVVGVSAGTCTVTVTSANNPNVKAEIKVTVSDPNKISEIKLSKTEMNIAVGKSDISYVIMLPESVSDKREIWTSSDEKIAVVDEWGNVTGVSAGTCTVTVTSANNPNVKADIKVTVSSTDKISEIKLSKTEMNIAVGKSDISYVTMLPETVPNKDEVWTSSDEKIAMVDKWGNVTGISEGACTVTVTSVDNPNVKAEIKVTVSEGQTHNFQQINGLTYIDGILIANKSYALPSTYSPEMDATTIQQFNLLSEAASKDGLNIYLSSGYRSYSQQNTIYNNYVSWYGKEKADTFSARAGHSEHQTGLAIDVNTIDDSFAGTPEAVWLENHAHEYGFIIRYPKGKESITGYKYEPWHIRYLGVEKAMDVYNSGLTLEEYLGIDSYYH
ncbi:MAG: D-alanyl-D-alanine carboxypeptidase family protein [Ruminococcus sp.]|nr:D-alanyl-D-alanine carboxypeptidase family protein [Ruminococcus sp.]